MPAPTPYARLKNFLQYALDHPAAPYNSSDHDAELDAIAQTLYGLVTDLNIIQRNDGKLANASVHPDALSSATQALIGGGWTPKGLWLTATSYALKDVVQQGTASYVCAAAHVAGVFATDLAAGKWVTLGKTNGDVAAGIAFTPIGNIIATDVQAALAELDGEKAKIGGDALQAFLAAEGAAAYNAVVAGQLQKNTLVSAVAGGTADALTATIASGLTVVTDKMRLAIEARFANGTTAPTFALTLGSTATPPKTVAKGAGSALVAGDIAGAEHVLDLVFSTTLDCWLLLNPAFPVGVTTSNLTAFDVKNVGLSFSVGGSALTASVTTATGGAPTVSDPVQAAMRDVTLATGRTATRQVITALNIVVPSGATLGHQNGAEAPMHFYLIDNGGTLEPAVSTKFFGFAGTVSTTQITAGSTSATTMYSTAARLAVPFAWIGSTRDTQTVAGTWAAVPSLVNLVRSTSEIPAQLAAIGAPMNCALAWSVAGNALTVAIKQADGVNDPTMYQPAVIPFRDATVAGGGVTWVAVTAPSTLVVSSGSTLGTRNSIPFRVWAGAFLDAGVVRPFVANCVTTVAAVGSGSDVTALNSLGLGAWGIGSSTAEGGAGAADSAQTFYTGAAVAAKPYQALGWASWEAGLAAAGTWSAGPTRAQAFMPGMPTPGQVVQRQRTDTGAVNTGVTTIPGDDTIPQNNEGDQYMSQAITPTSAANVLRVEAMPVVSNTAAGGHHLAAALFQDAIANALRAVRQAASTTGFTRLLPLVAVQLAAMTTATTFKVRAGADVAGTTTFNGAASARIYGGVMNSFLEAQEIMG